MESTIGFLVAKEWTLGLIEKGIRSVSMSEGIFKLAMEGLIAFVIASTHKIVIEFVEGGPCEARVDLKVASQMAEES